MDESATHRRGRHRFEPRYLGVVVVLILAMAATWGARSWYVGRVAGGMPQQQEAVASRALGRIEQQFTAMQQALLGRGAALAENPTVVQAMQQRQRGEREESVQTLVRFFARLDLPKQWAVELYDPSLARIAWNGFSMPLDAAPEAPRFLESFQTAIAEDSGWQQALVVWCPIHDGVRVLGVVRMLERLHAHTPVQNRYIRDYNIEETWERDTRLAIQARFTQPFAPRAPARGQARLLQGLDGTILGHVIAEPPPPDRLLDTTGRRFDDVLSFWMTLLLSWLMAGLWAWYRRADASKEPRRTAVAAGVRLGLVAVAWWGIRFVLLLLDVPARWQRGKAPFAPLFDPSHFASTFGGGLMRSAGDFFVTAVFGLFFALAVLAYTARFRIPRSGRLGGVWYGLRMASSPRRFLTALALITLLAAGLTMILAGIARQSVLDSTLDLFTREDLFPRSLDLFIFCTLLVCTLSVMMLIVGLVWTGMGGVLQGARRATWPRWTLLVGIPVAVAGPLLGLYTVLEGPPAAAWPVVGVFLFVGFLLAALSFLQQDSELEWLTLRSVLPTIFVMSILLYPLFFNGFDEQRRVRMIDAVESFDRGHDPRVLFAVREILAEARAQPAAVTVLADTTLYVRQSAFLDSLSMEMLRGSLLASLGAYDVSLAFLDAAGRPVGRYDASHEGLSRPALDQNDALQFDMLRQMYAESGSEDILVEQLTGSVDPDRLQYAGLVPVRLAGETRPVGWIMARAEPHVLLQEANVPFLRVLLPDAYSNLYANLSLAVFREGVLIRSFGRDFGRYRLDESVRTALITQPAMWRRERVKERRFQTYYQRRRLEQPDEPVLEPIEQNVVAVRASSITPFDHLYYLLRLIVAGLLVGLPFYGVGLYLRRQAGLLPAPRVRFRDKVLNAFLAVGIIAVIAVGFVGVQVVTEENDRAVQSWLRQHLQRVEETLVVDARRDEMPYHILGRLRIDSLAAQVGLDLNVYQGDSLIDYSRPQLIRERLIDRRLPIQAYEALKLDGYRFTFVEEELGAFSYTAGYHALLDEQGQPRYIVSVPTLPEQERIEEERARTVAYLFGALLALVVLVMVTASLLANALARPIARLREGLEAVAKGRFERMLPVDTRDEVGELVQTFNVMQEQLAESRRRLAQQERQLAWREMARQVAHEIKNPLTPMKLSVQHLRRAYEDAEAAGGPSSGMEGRAQRFARLFERITGTLVEQIDALARIANEFSSFARMPTRILERLDLNVVVHEAVALMQEEAGTDIELHLADTSLVLEADREELRRIYINLIKNALQALPHDRNGRVTVATYYEPDRDGHAGYAYSTVTDTGLGIAEALRQKIFEPNFSTKTSGTGLGLAIARKSVEAFNGEIGFETEEGRGTTFWIRLPLVV